MLLYEGNDSFLEEVISFEMAKYVILPVPFELTNSFLKGTRFAPRSIIEASKSLENYDYEFNVLVQNLIYTTNELSIPPSVDKAIDVVKQSTKDIIDAGKIPILIGGEHLLTYGASLAYDDDVVFVIFDAHADFKQQLNGIALTHASTSYLISQRNKIVLIGVRSLSLEEKKDLEERKIDVAFIDDDFDKILKSIKNKRLYISIDSDVLDPSIIQSTGTPQPNGLSYTQLLQILKTLISSNRLVGFDITEIIPSQNKITETYAAKLIIDIISMKERKDKGV